MLRRKNQRRKYTASALLFLIVIIMGQVMRIMSYDRAANERNAVSALNLVNHQLSWFRLDDGVMGGQSETNHHIVSKREQQEKDDNDNEAILHFVGTINTYGGGFASIRSKIPEGTLSSSTQAIKLQCRGDGKTYKLLMTDGNRMAGAPMSRTPSWQANIPTRAIITSSVAETCSNDNDDGAAAGASNTNDDDEWEEVTIPLSSLLPSFGGSSMQVDNDVKFDATKVREIGIMLSLKLANGESNPTKTFGEGIFPFQLLIKSIEPVPPPQPTATPQN